MTKDCKTQAERFVETARRLGADEGEETFRTKLAVIARQKPREEKSMSIVTENYNGFELRLRMVGRPPFGGMVRRLGSSMLEPGHVSANSEAELRAALAKWVDQLSAETS